MKENPYIEYRDAAHTSRSAERAAIPELQFPPYMPKETNVSIAGAFL